MSEPQTQLGKLIEGNSQRDAIHIAVAPVIAATELHRGDRIGFVGGGKVGRIPAEVIGIVDPFLTETVYPGDKFWMFLLPNTITSLKHVWEHPAFEVDTPPTQSKSASETWLRNFINGADCPDYEEVIAAAVGGGAEQWSDEYLHFNGSDAHGDIPPEFWDHVEIVTGRKITRRPTYFSCSC